jgi:hypothetical protein
MANVVKINIEEDGPRNVVAKVTLVLDSADLSGTTILDPATLDATNPPTDLLAVHEIQYSVMDGLVVGLYWNATTPKRIVSLTGRGIFPVGPNYGGIQNNAGVGVDGKITCTTTGFSSATLYATMVIHCVKQSRGTQGSDNAPILTELGDIIETETNQPILTE